MSTADSQLLAASSAFSSDVYKPVIRKGKASDKEMMWTGRIVVLGISVAALIIASNPNAGSIMALVSNAWGIFELPLDLQSCSASSGSALTSRVLLQES